MAFFGVTQLGSQNPIGDKMIVNPRGQSHLLDNDVKAEQTPSLQEESRCLQNTENLSCLPLLSSTDIHHGSHAKHREMVKRIQTPRAPDQLYRMPLTDSQQYGWMAFESLAPWARVKRFPKKKTEMTEFVEKMSMTDREFSLF